MGLQDERFIGVSTPLGEDELLLLGFHGHEELSRLFRYELDLSSDNRAIDFDGIVGKNVTIRLDLSGESSRHINGFVSRFVQTADGGDHAEYRAEVVPWLWFLTRTADCRIFQKSKVPDIVTQIFDDLGFSDYELRIDTGSYREWEYCVQYRESDFNFVSRLLEQEGIYYFFRHEDGKHTLVLCDSPTKHEDYPDYGTIPYLPPTTQGDTPQHISAWTIEKSVQPGGFSHTDFNFTKSKTSLMNQSQASCGYDRSSYEVYDYPGEFGVNAEGERYARVRLEELQARHEYLCGQADARGIAPGFTFTLEDYPRDDQNRKYLVIATDVTARTAPFSAGGRGGEQSDFSCRLVAMDAGVQYRAERSTPKPIVQGAQTAIVVGPPGEEIWPDEYGRVKVQFHWDREGKRDESSSCWVRVSQVWAGANWGFMALPRIGHEVIVSFMEGDPDQPIITGRVYNDVNMPPYTLPANKTQTGIKSRSSKGGTGDNFNEIRFEDKKGSEQLYIHAERNQDILVEHNETHWVGIDRKKTIKRDETTHVERDRTETVDRDESITIGNNRTESVGKDESLTIGNNRTEAVGKDEVVTIGNTRTESVGKDKSVNIGGKSERVVASDDTITVGGKRTTSVGNKETLSVGTALVVSAGTQITFTTGSAKLVMKANGDIQLSGNNIEIKGSGKIKVKASSDIEIKGSKVAVN